MQPADSQAAEKADRLCSRIDQVFQSHICPFRVKPAVQFSDQAFRSYSLINMAFLVPCGAEISRIYRQELPAASTLGVHVRLEDLISFVSALQYARDY